MSKWILIVFVILNLVVSFAQADTVYRWVDAQGNVHYSDHPHPGASKVLLPQTQTYAPPAAAQMTAPMPLPAMTPTAGYAQFALATPGNQATLWYVHEVTVSVSLSPDLRSGDTITYHLDGKTIGPTQAMSVIFKDVDRGEHTASATLNAANGATMLAGPVTFYVRQKSIISPKPPR